MSVGHVGALPRPSDRFDFELELAVAIAKTGRRLTLENAMEHVAGHTALMDLDLTARDWQLHPKHVVKFDLFAGKGFDDSCPMGPDIVPARFVDPENLQLRFWSNGDLRLDFHTHDMTWSVAEQLVKITEHVTVEPGDVISTGCPSRLKSAWGRYPSPGDVLGGEITGLGRLDGRGRQGPREKPLPGRASFGQPQFDQQSAAPRAHIRCPTAKAATTTRRHMMKASTHSGNGTTRRGVLQGAAIGGAGIAAASLLPAQSASAAGAGNGIGFPGVDVVIDGSHATTEVTLLVRKYLAVKSEFDPDGMMAFFSRNPVTYIDAILGWFFGDWEAMRAATVGFMAEWPKGGKSYPTRILGDTSGAIVFFTDTAGLFGPSEIRAVGVVNFSNRKITRQIDYWDGRHFGISDTSKLKVPADQFPADFRESTVGETAARTMKNVSRKLALALRNGDGASAAALFGPSAVFEDIPAHVQIVGPRSIGSYLTDAASLLPYTGEGTAVRHIVGSAVGGGYEWTASEGPVPRGVIALELDDWGKITRLTTMWDGSLVDDSTLVALSRKAIER